MRDLTVEEHETYRHMFNHHGIEEAEDWVHRQIKRTHIYDADWIDDLCDELMEEGTSSDITL